MPEVELIDISADAHQAATLVDQACRESGFFCITGHGVPSDLTRDLTIAAQRFFALPVAEKERVAMPVAGAAWRGWFPLGGEVTNGIPDRKEGLYFGEELGPDHPRVRDGVPLHGANIFPMQVPELRSLVLQWLGHVRRVADQVMSLLARGLGLEADWFHENLTGTPTQLLRIFRYPMDGPGDWGVAEHTDYGLLTLLVQDDCGGLQVKMADGWRDVAPIPDAFVCNIGDMLERITSGAYRSTAHRVRNISGRDRLSIPYFFDPSWDSRIPTLDVAGANPDKVQQRWDDRSVFDFDGTYGQYLVEKVSKVFPHLVQPTSPR